MTTPTREQLADLARYRMLKWRDGHVWTTDDAAKIGDIDAFFRAKKAPSPRTLAKKFGTTPLHAWQAVAYLRDWPPHPDFPGIL